MPARYAKMIAKSKSQRVTETASFARVKLLYPVLHTCTLHTNNEPDDSGNAKPQRFYDATVRAMEQPRKRLNMASCQFSAGQKVKDISILEIEANYYVAFRSTENFEIADADKKALLEGIAASSAWPLFRDLYIHMASQSGEELPILPNIPKLRWLATE
jgi:hypothetical protein